MADFRKEIHRLQNEHTKPELIDALAERLGERTTSVNPLTTAMFAELRPGTRPVEYARKSEGYSELHNWQFAWLQKRIVDKAEETGIPISFVDPEYTSQVCHACKHVGTRPEQAEFRCTNDECWVTEYQADINAAANIARRTDPWGESLPWKTGRR